MYVTKLNNSKMVNLNINEIFYSLQGEAREVGLPTVFVRLTGCPLRCTYCDTEYAFKGNNMLSIDEINAIDEISTAPFESIEPEILNKEYQRINASKEYNVLFYGSWRQASAYDCQVIGWI